MIAAFRAHALHRHSDYGAEVLDEGHVASDPLVQFDRWLAEADARDVYEPNAMVLATVDADGTPSSRTVLLRGVDDRGFVFYTDRESRKGRALAANPTDKKIRCQVLEFNRFGNVKLNVRQSHLETAGLWESDELAVEGVSGSARARARMRTG